MKTEDIQIGMTVSDPTIKVFYEWVSGVRRISNLETIHILCSMCGFPSKYMLYEKEPITNTFGDSYRAYYCIDCAGVEDLVPIFTKVG
jgi:hypothetical protein